ncbi:hypothetical protein Tco_0363116 [Tanacetum coccineum]
MGAEEEMKKLAEEEAIKAALIQDFDDIQARIEADRLLAARLQEEERETFTVEERAKYLYDTVAAQRRKKHADLKNKNFEEIQVLYKKIKEMNEESKDPKNKRVVNETPREEDTAKVPAEQETTEQGTKKRKSGHVKMIARKSTLDSEIMETKSFVSKLHKVSSPDVESSTPEITPEGIELILWGDLKIMMESLTEENDQGDIWNNQQDWEIFRWSMYEACGVCILELKDGTVIYMLVERRYPLSKELSQKEITDLGLEVEENTSALQLVGGDSLSNSLMKSNVVNRMRKELAIPEQTATGKGISNPLMAGSLPRTTKLT